ncbi:hypothetical protein ACFQ60_14185 [Streptomyces zhihengii]
MGRRRPAPYAPASLAEEGFVHCSADEPPRSPSRTPATARCRGGCWC